MALLSRVPEGFDTGRNRLGKYQLIASLGHGGMAKVYLALVAGPSAVNKLMVLKVLNRETLYGAEGSIELFWDEARLAARLQHANIVQTYEVGELEGHFFLAMEYLDGQVYRVLQARTAKNRLPVEEELRILVEVAHGLHYAHELKGFGGAPLNVVHRDVSPQNVFITYDGQIKLIDFGIAKSSDAGHETRVGVIKGKINYIAPEQLRGDALDRRADIFALGVMLWEAIAGRRFAGPASVAEVTKMHARLKGEEPNIRTIKPDVDEELAVIIDRAIAVDREQRWSDAASFAEALEAYMERLVMRPTSKSLAAHMRTLFEKDRSALHEVIDERVHAIVEGKVVDQNHELPTLPSADETQTGSGPLGRSTSIPTTEPHTVNVSGIQLSAGGQRKSRRNVLAVVGVMAAVAIGASLFMRDGHTDRALTTTVEPQAQPADVVTTTPSAAVSPQAPSKRAAAPSEHATIQMRISVVPSVADAEVTIDGAKVETPFLGIFAQGDALHRIEAKARGYRPLIRLVSFAQDQELALTLEPYTAPAKHPRARVSSEREAPNVAPVEQGHSARPEESRPVDDAPKEVVPGAEMRPTKRKVGQTQIDTADPYAN